MSCSQVRGRSTQTYQGGTWAQSQGWVLCFGVRRPKTYTHRIGSLAPSRTWLTCFGPRQPSVQTYRAWTWAQLTVKEIILYVMAVPQRAVAHKAMVFITIFKDATAWTTAYVRADGTASKESPSGACNKKTPPLPPSLPSPPPLPNRLIFADHESSAIRGISLLQPSLWIFSCVFTTRENL